MQAEKTMHETRVTYTLELEGKFFIIENVPARVCEETGEQFFSPETVEQFQQTLWEHKKPKKTIVTRLRVCSVSFNRKPI